MRRFAQAPEDFVRRRKYLPSDLAAKMFRSGPIGMVGPGGVITPIVSPAGIITSGVKLPPVDQLQSQFEIDRQKYLKQIMYDLDVLRQIQTIGRTIIPRVISITNTPVQLIKATDPKGFIILNPSATAGLTNTGTLLASAARAIGASGNTQATPLGVANFDNIKLFLDISANASLNVVTVTAQTQDPLSLKWANSQVNVFSQSAVGTYYTSLGNVGVDSQFAISWAVSAVGGTTSFSVGFVLKDGLPGSASGTSRTVFLGNSGVNTTSGFDLLEGQRYPFYFLQNAELWGISGVAAGINIKIFELS